MFLKNLDLYLRKIQICFVLIVIADFEVKERELNKFLTLKYSFTTKKSTLMQKVVFLFFFYSFLLILHDDAWIALGCFYYFDFWCYCHVLFKSLKHVLNIWLQWLDALDDCLFQFFLFNFKICKDYQNKTDMYLL